MEIHESHKEGGGGVWSEPPFRVVIVSEKDYPKEILEASLTKGENECVQSIPLVKRSDWLLGRMACKRVIQTYAERVIGTRIALQDIEIISGMGTPPTFILRQSDVLLANDENASCACTEDESSPRIVRAEARSFPEQQPGSCRLMPRIGDMHDRIVLLPQESYALTLSHSHGVAVAQVCSRREVKGIGIDVERIRSFRDDTLRAFLTEDEYHRCFDGKNLSPYEATFYWSMKEAYLKAIGTGLRLHPQMVEIPPRDHCQGCTTIGVKGESVPVQLYWTTISDFYIITNIIV